MNIDIHHDDTRDRASGEADVAAPMFGGVPVAEAGNLNIVTAGDPKHVEQVVSLLEAVSARVWPVGDAPRQANVVKVAGQVLIAAAIQSMPEAVSIGERGGVDATTLVELYTSTITPGPVYTNYGRLIAEKRYVPAGFTPVLGRKDVDLARTQAAETGLRLPVTDLLSGLLTETIEAGHGRDDWASLADGRPVVRCSRGRRCPSPAVRLSAARARRQRLSDTFQARVRGAPRRPLTAASGVGRGGSPCGPLRP